MMIADDGAFAAPLMAIALSGSLGTRLSQVLRKKLGARVS